jgi:predicted AlkP superfamily phosphohydrolase/phosphomutase
VSLADGRPRVVVFGLDAAEWTLVESLLRSGGLPHLARLRAAGTTCRLRQQTPLTEQPWTAFLSGTPAPETSLRFDPGTYEACEIGAPRNRPFYDQPGLRAIVLDVPRMTLAYPNDGVQITGWGGHHLGYPRASRPPGLLTALDREIGPHPVFAGFSELRWFQSGALERFANGMIVGIERRVEVLRALTRHVPDWDLIVTVSPEAHTVGQILWYCLDDRHPLSTYRDREAARRQIYDVYRALDDAIGRLVSDLPEAVVLVCSVHGIKTNDHDVMSALLSELLSRVYTGEGLFNVPDARSWREAGFPPVVPGLSTFAANFGAPRSSPQRLAGRLGYHGRRYAPALMDVVQSIRAGVEHENETDKSWDEIGESPMPHHRHVANRYRHLWRRMKAFGLPTYTLGRVRINVRGRERDGLVAPENYETVCDEVETVLRACRNPRTGEGIVDAIRRVPPGDRDNPERSYADMTIVWKGCADALEHPDVGVIGPLAYDRTGSHSTAGFVVMAGPGIPQYDAGERPALDLTPTIVRLLGREPSAACVGRSILPIA